jgi:HD-like signal output (HDOD) protein
MAGMLHDIGELVLVANLPGQYTAALELAAARQIPVFEAEKATLGATHADVGGYLIGLWGLPGAIGEAVLFHHSPDSSLNDAFSALTAVHVADVLAHEKVGARGGVAVPAIDQNYLNQLGLSDRLPAWREACQIPQTQGCPA